MNYPKEAFAWLEERKFNKYSQFGEDGLLEAIFERIGTANKWVMECGAADGIFFSNSKKLIDDGWSAVLVESDVEKAALCLALHRKNDRVSVIHETVTTHGSSSLDSVLWTSGRNVPTDIDLAVIDVDSSDYWLFNSLLRYRPRVVMCEYDPNADPDFIPAIDGEGQAGLQAIIGLGIGKLYYPVCATWSNVIFVRQELVHLVASDSLTTMADVKPVVAAPKVAAVISIPQLGHNVHNGCVLESLMPFGIGLRQCYGVYWNQALSDGITKVLEQKPDYVLTLDYDALFTSKHISDLMTLALDNPDVDVIIPCMTKREGNGLLAHTSNQDPSVPGVNLNDPLIPIQLGHFGLTLFKASVFDRIKKPWMIAVPDKDGGWGEGHIDADMNFWLNCEASNIKVALARHIRVGHIEYMATIPNAEDPRKTDYVHVGEWRRWAVTENQAVNDRLQKAKGTHA